MLTMWMQGIVIDIFVWICNGQFNDTTHTYVLTTVWILNEGGKYFVFEFPKIKEEIFVLKNILEKRERKETWHKQHNS